MADWERRYGTSGIAGYNIGYSEKLYETEKERLAMVAVRKVRLENSQLKFEISALGRERGKGPPLAQQARQQLLEQIDLANIKIASAQDQIHAQEMEIHALQNRTVGGRRVGSSSLTGELATAAIMPFKEQVARSGGDSASEVGRLRTQLRKKNEGLQQARQEVEQLRKQVESHEAGREDATSATQSLVAAQREATQLQARVVDLEKQLGSS